MWTKNKANKLFVNVIWLLFCWMCFNFFVQWWNISTVRWLQCEEEKTFEIHTLFEVIKLRMCWKYCQICIIELIWMLKSVLNTGHSKREDNFALLLHYPTIIQDFENPSSISLHFFIFKIIFFGGNMILKNMLVFQ